MPVLKITAIIIASWLAPNSAIAYSALQNQELIDKSGLAATLKELPGAMQSSVGAMRQQGMQIDQKFEKAWTDAARTAFGPEQSLAIIDQGLQKLLTPEDKAALLQHYNSPLGRRISALEVKAAQPGEQAKAQAYAQTLLADPGKNADRLALYRAIDKASGATATVTNISINIATAMTTGMASATPGPKVDTGAIRAQIEKQRSAMSQKLAAATLASMAYTYRDLSAQDLTAYLAFLNSPAGKTLNAGVGTLLNQALALQSEDFGRQLAKNLGRKGV
ncbi:MULTISPECIES: DUF2059 domain-containing protein [Rhodomicrobium]|uniref:DUF2059 domain-containing protein n=1 Tax=Rhodomicrobium TaxID=1068 RepID=UPI000B4B5F1B|nr:MULTISPECIES: DUF2059 domain-containing protein [Rhodomicrobium]